MSHAFDPKKQVPMRLGMSCLSSRDFFLHFRGGKNAIQVVSREVFKQIGVGTKKAQALFQAADSDQDGVIQVHEFIAWLTQQRLKAKVNKNQET